MPSEQPRRYFAAIGVSKYDDASMNLDSVAHDVAWMRQFFVESKVAPHIPALPELAESPTAAAITTALGAWLLSLKPSDRVVLYFNAHADMAERDAHLQARDSPRTKFAGRSVSGQMIGEMIGQAPPENVLVIVDTCVAGRLSMDILYALQRTATNDNVHDQQGDWGQAVLSGAWGQNSAEDGRFVEAFAEFTQDERYTGTNDEFIPLDGLIRGIKKIMAASGAGQSVDLMTWHSAPKAVPNPQYGTRARGGLFASGDLASHFDPESRGASPNETVSYFTGRVDEMTALTSWLTAHGTESIKVITGSPGSGKSALLSRFVRMSDPAGRAAIDVSQLPREAVPPAGAIRAAVWCRNRSLDQVAVDAGLAFGSPVTNAAEFLSAAARQPRSEAQPLCFAFDAVDEAVEGASKKIASELIRPLAALPHVKVLVATRPKAVRFAPGEPPTDLLQDLGAPASSYLVLDGTPQQKADMQACAAARLQAVNEPNRNTPYRDNPELAAKVASRIVERAGNSFLVAAVSARTLSMRPAPVDPDSNDLRLPAEAGTALAEYFDALPDPDEVKAVLRPVAWSRGWGLPWGDLWSRLVNALSDGSRRYDDDAIRRVLGRAADLVVEESTPFGPVYRLFHEALAEQLRGDADASATHRIIARELMADWRTGRANAHSYVLAFLAQHLALANDVAALRELVTDPEWESAKRRRFGNPVSFLADVDLVIEAAQRTAPVDYESLALACAVHARFISVAPPRVIFVLAQVGQLQRAELMARNIRFAIDRCLAFASLAPLCAMAGDPAAAERCFNEAWYAVNDVDAIDRPIAWAIVANNALQCGWKAGATEAAGHARRTFGEIAPSRSAEWMFAVISTAQLLFGMEDPSGRQEIRERFQAIVDVPRTVPELHAASVVGDTAMIFAARDAFELSPDAPQYGVAAVAYAMMTAGLTADARALLAGLVKLTDRDRADAATAAWALAMTNRFDEALELATAEQGPEERAFGLSIIVQASAWHQDAAVRDEWRGRVLAHVRKDVKRLRGGPARGAQPLAREAFVSRSNDELVALLSVLALLDQSDAVSLAEELARRNIEPTALNTSALPRQPGAPRRALDPNAAAPTAEETFAKKGLDAAAAGHRLTAAAIMRGLRLPEHRAALANAIAMNGNHIEEWVSALLQSRFVNEASVAKTIEHFAARGLDPEAAARLRENLRHFQVRWAEAAFAERYETLRATDQRGEDRTRELENLMESVPNPEQWKSEDVDRLIESSGPGLRMLAIDLMWADPRLRNGRFDALLGFVANSISGFEQFHALRVLTAMAAGLTPAERAELGGVIEAQRRRGYIRPGGDRAALIARLETIFESVE